MPSACLIRIADGERALEVAEVERARQRIEENLGQVPPGEREHLANALLQRAIATLLRQSG